MSNQYQQITIEHRWPIFAGSCCLVFVFTGRDSSDAVHRETNEDGGEDKKYVANKIRLARDSNESDAHPEGQDCTNQQHRDHKESHASGRFTVFRIGHLWSLVWSRIFRIHDLSFHSSQQSCYVSTVTPNAAHRKGSLRPQGQTQVFSSSCISV